MIEEIIMILALTGIVFYRKNKVTGYTESTKEWLIFFLIFLIIMTAYSIDLVNHFTYTRFSMLALIFVLGITNYYTRFKKIQLK